MNSELKPELKPRLKIAFGYKCGSGKDTAVDHAIEMYGGTRFSFAKPIYDIQRYAQQICGFKQEKDRQFLQYVGTEWARNIEEDVWVRVCLESVPDVGNAFISDCRFPNEFEALKKDGWTLIKLVRDIQEERKGTGSHAHQSEVALDSKGDDDWDYVIMNNGSLEQFKRHLDLVISRELKKW